MKKHAYIILSLMLGLFSCVKSPEKEYGPINQPTNPPPTEVNSEFYVEFQLLLDDYISQQPEDKQKHILASKVLFYLVPSESTSEFGVAMENFIKVMQIGYDKELQDKGIDPNITGHIWRKIIAMVVELDYVAASEELDQGDLQADLFGVSASMLQYADDSLSE